MSSKPRQQPSAVLRSVLATAMVLLGLVVVPWTLMPATARAAGTSASEQALKAAGADEFSYSDLRAAIADRKVKAATLWPAKFEAEIVLKDGAKRKVGYPPTDEALADELSAAGAKVKIDTGFASAGRSSRGAR